nr:unnamed protein product [Haemonchus contortus]
MVPVLSGTWRHLSSRRSIQSGIKDRSHCHVNSRRVSHLRSVFHLQPPAYFLGMYRSAGAIAHQLRSLSHWSSDMCHLPSEWTIQSGIKDVLCRFPIGYSDVASPIQQCTIQSGITDRPHLRHLVSFFPEKSDSPFQPSASTCATRPWEQSPNAKGTATN